MRLARPYVARKEDVTITRDGERAVIQYVQPNVGSVHLAIGPKLAEMSDDQILDLHNAIIRSQEEVRASYVHVAKEIPPGRPQVSYFDKGQYWVPRGDVLRVLVHSNAGNDEPVIDIDGQAFTWHEFGRMLLTWEGWGVRMVMVPDDELEQIPKITVQEPEEIGRDD